MIFNISNRSLYALFLSSGLLFSFSSSTLNANQQIMQEVVSGSTIPKFVEPVPIVQRVDGTKKLEVSAEEFQQKILPSSFYKKLPSCVEYKSVETGEPSLRHQPKKRDICLGI